MRSGQSWTVYNIGKLIRFGGVYPTFKAGNQYVFRDIDKFSMLANPEVSDTGMRISLSGSKEGFAGYWTDEKNKAIRWNRYATLIVLNRVTRSVELMGVPSNRQMLTWCKADKGFLIGFEAQTPGGTTADAYIKRWFVGNASTITYADGVLLGTVTGFGYADRAETLTEFTADCLSIAFIDVVTHGNAEPAIAIWSFSADYSALQRYEVLLASPPQYLFPGMLGYMKQVIGLRRDGPDKFIALIEEFTRTINTTSATNYGPEVSIDDTSNGCGAIQQNVATYQDWAESTEEVNLTITVTHGCSIAPVKNQISHEITGWTEGLLINVYSTSYELHHYETVQHLNGVYFDASGSNTCGYPTALNVVKSQLVTFTPLADIESWRDAHPADLHTVITNESAVNELYFCSIVDDVSVYGVYDYQTSGDHLEVACKLYLKWHGVLTLLDTIAIDSTRTRPQNSVAAFFSSPCYSKTKKLLFVLGSTHLDNNFNEYPHFNVFVDLLTGDYIYERLPYNFFEPMRKTMAVTV